MLPVAFGLKRDQAGLRDAALARATGGPDYGRWLSTEQIATYGAASGVAESAFEVLTQAGFAGAIDPTRGLIIGQMSVQDAEALLGVDMIVTPGDVAVVKPARAPAVPRALSTWVTEVVGLALAVPGSAVASPDSGAATAATPSAKASAPTSAGAAATPPPAPPCPAPVALTRELNDVYGLGPLQEASRGGKGVTIALLQIDQTSQRALQLFSDCFGVRIPPVTTVAVDGSDPYVFGPTAEESTLDIVAASLLAPDLEGIRSYQFNPRSSVLFPLAAAVADGLRPGGPQVISTSVGVCDQQLRREAINLSEWVLAAAAAAGMTVIASAGDTGSSACVPGTTAQSSQYPASSPMVLAVGGTEFVNAAGIRREEVWNDSPALAQAGGGSEVSSLPRPDYQRGVPGAGEGAARVVPDVAFVAAPATFGPIPVCTDDGHCVHKVVGGTSATAPGLAAAVSELADALTPGTEEPRRLGLLNPQLYALAADPATRPIFRDVTVGNNDLYQAGCCSAAVGFDPASGWGSVDFTALLEYLRTRTATAGG